MSVLHWSEQWADVVGGDGHIITDLLGRVAPCWTDDDAERIATVWRDHDRDTIEAVARTDGWPLAERNGLNAAMACARQSARRAVDAHAPFDRDASGGDRWHRWRPAAHVLEHTVGALVVRRVAPADVIEQLTAPWVEAIGDLPAFIDGDTEKPLVACPMCGHPRDVRVVTEAEAARRARMLRRHDELGNERLIDDLAAVRRMLAERVRDHPSWEQVDDTLRRALDSAPRLPAAARKHIETALRMKPAAEAQPGSVADDEPMALFAADGAVS